MPTAFWRNHFARFLLKNRRASDALTLLLDPLAEAQARGTRANIHAAYQSLLREAAESVGCGAATPPADVAERCSRVQEALESGADAPPPAESTGNG
jgi:hypothetical protein